MAKLLITFAETACEGPCVLCARNTNQVSGLVLAHPETPGPVCQECGRRHTPTLAALLDLAQVARKIGRISHHSRSWVSMESLLELTRAAESFFHQSGAEGKSA